MNKPSIKKNFSYNLLYQILNVITPFITAPYISRVLGAEAIGIQSYTSSVQYYFLLVAVLGTASYGEREIAMKRDNLYERSKSFWEIELMTVTTSLVALAGWIVVILLSSEYRVYYTILSLGIFASMLDISWFFAGLESFKLITIYNTVFKLVNVAIIFIVIHSPGDLIWYILATSICSLLYSAVIWVCLKGKLVRVPAKELHLGPHYKQAFIYFLPTIATSVYTVLDKTLIGAITHDNSENGYYQQAEKIINLAKSVVFVALNSVVSARSSYLFAEKNFGEIKKLIVKSMEYIFFMGFGCCFGIIGVARTFVPVFFGEGYDNVVTLLYIFAPILVIIGISNCLGCQYYTPCGYRLRSSVYLIIGAVVNLVLNCLMIPRLKSEGAAIASVIAELIITVLFMVFSNGFGTIGMMVKIGWKKLLAGVIMVIPLYFMNNIGILPIIRLVIQIVAGVGIYIAVLLLCRDNFVLQAKSLVLEKIKKLLKH